MNCRHGNHYDGCDICDEVDASFEAGRRSALAEQPAPMFQPNRVISYAAAMKLRELGYEWMNDEWKHLDELPEQPAPAAQQGAVAQHRDLHSHMMVVAHRAADAASSHGQKPTSQKEFVRAICTAIQADKNLLAKLAPQAPKENQS